jgi:hypothetical protein
MIAEKENKSFSASRHAGFCVPSTLVTYMVGGLILYIHLRLAGMVPESGAAGGDGGAGNRTV